MTVGLLVEFTLEAKTCVSAFAWSKHIALEAGTYYFVTCDKYLKRREDGVFKLVAC